MSTIQLNNPGKIAFGTPSDLIKIRNITAGIGIVLFDRTNKTGIGCHIVLQPLIRRHITDMVSILKKKSGDTGNLWAKIAGGAEFISKTIAAKKLAPHVINMCKQLGIKIAGHDLGGNETRTLIASLATGATKVCTTDGDRRI